MIHAAAVGEHQFVQELVTRIAKPKEFVQPDPSKFIVQADVRFASDLEKMKGNTHNPARTDRGTGPSAAYQLWY